ncbi:hypothetical protein [Breoghania sp.]|uniref:hypothetical protein n=1 Tax=Breoghania sp. TaxID=2065378 RepID=UPI0026129266|nr:hypothetical protein [Breoghania sp.]MDJ0929562.1 hypothetical protein [Breoghania sp.]
MTYTEHSTFRIPLPFNIRPHELLVATAGAITVFSLAMFTAGFGSAASDDATAAPVKGDQLTIAQEDACAGQAWGHWNAECLRTLAEKHDISVAPSRTVEFRDAGRRLSVLVKEPASP